MGPTLDESYARCRALARRHGKTYYFATRLLPAWKRRHVWALYGFARYADDILDDRASTLTTAEKRAALATFGDDLLSGRAEHPVNRAMAHTMRAFAIPPEHVEAFLASMAMDLTVDRYETFDDLMGYMYGSAAVIGLMMAPILEYTDDAALDAAADLGVAFQLTNFLRDVGEDLDRGRVYLPQTSLRRFDLTVDDLRAFAAAGVGDERYLALQRCEIARCRAIYARADPGISLLVPSSRAAIRVARLLYSEILVKIEDAGYQTFAGRAHVTTAGKVRRAVPVYVRTRLAA